MRLLALAAALIAAAAVLALVLDDADDGGGDRPPATEIDVGTVGTEAVPPVDAADQLALAGLDHNARATVAAARSLIVAIDERDARGICALLAPSAERELPELRRAPSCELGVAASIGSAPPHGAPHWRSSRIAGLVSVKVDGAAARVTTTVVTKFVGDRQPSIEDEIAYLRGDAARWAVIRPTATLYRALGYPEPPLSSFAPPPG